MHFAAVKVVPDQNRIHVIGNPCAVHERCASRLQQGPNFRVAEHVGTIAELPR